MAPSTPQPGDDSHQQLLDQLDFTTTREQFRKRIHQRTGRNWKPSQRRNKNTKQIISENQRKEASALASQDNSGATTPLPQTAADSDGVVSPSLSNGTTTRQPNIAQAAQSLSTFVLEKNLQRNVMSLGPAITYTNIEIAPSLHPAHTKHYCDITGLPSRYTDPKTRLRYHDKEVFAVIRTLPQNSIDDYLAARGALFVLK